MEKIIYMYTIIYFVLNITAISGSIGIIHLTHKQIESTSEVTEVNNKYLPIGNLPPSNLGAPSNTPLLACENKLNKNKKANSNADTQKNIHV